MKKERVVFRSVRTPEGLEFTYKKVGMACVRRADQIASGLKFPKNYYLLAYDAFKNSVDGYGEFVDKLPAGIVLAVGINILEFSNFFSKPEQVQEDLEAERKHWTSYFEQIRSLACFHFGYKFEESEQWDYDTLLEMAARLETVLGIDLSFIRKEAGQLKEGQFTIKKGDQIPDHIINDHNKESKEMDNFWRREERAVGPPLK